MKRVVIFGQSGSGKTTLLNLLCGTNYTCPAYAHTSTAAKYQLESRQHPMRRDQTVSLVDVPGIRSALPFEAATNLRILQKALSVPFRALLLTVKYDDDLDAIAREVAEVRDMIPSPRLVVVITHYDRCADPLPTQHTLQRTLNCALVFSGLSPPTHLFAKRTPTNSFIHDQILECITALDSDHTIAGIEAVSHVREPAYQKAVQMVGEGGVEAGLAYLREHSGLHPHDLALAASDLIAIGGGEEVDALYERCYQEARMRKSKRIQKRKHQK